MNSLFGKFLTRSILIVWSTASVLTFVIAYKARALAVDDAYIHRRIAAHYALNGHAWYNTTEQVMGTSSPAWTIVLAIAYRIVGDHPVVVPAIEAFAVGSAVALAGLLSFRLSRTKSARSIILRLFCASTIAWICLLDSAVAQMETPLAIALLLAGMLLLTGDASPSSTNSHAHAGLVMITLAVFTRLELGMLLLLAIVCLALYRQLRFGTLVYAVFVAVAGCLWEFNQFRTLIPNTVGAKEKAYHVSARDTMAVFALSGWKGPAFLVLLCVLLVLVYKKRSFAGTPLASVLLLTGGFGLGMLYVARGVLVFPWYTPLVLAPCLLGIFLLVGEHSSNAIKGVALVLIVMGMRGPISLGKHVIMEAILGHRVKDGLVDAQAARVHEYLKVGYSLNAACPNGTLLTSEIGGLGYSFHGRVLDGMGLVTPAAVAFHPLHFPQDSPSGNEGAIPPAYARAVQADMIATYQIMGEVVIVQGPTLGYVDFVVPPFLKEDYVPADFYLGTMHIMVRRGGACSIMEVQDSLLRGFGTFN